MSFSQMLEILQDKDSSKVILIKLGHFYIATGRDAVLLHKKLNLKCTCFKNNICKVGIPVNSLEKYVEKFNQMQYSYIIYDYDKQVIKTKAYNEIADYCYSKLETNQRVFIYGKISKNNVIVKEICQYWLGSKKYIYFLRLRY